MLEPGARLRPGGDPVPDVGGGRRGRVRDGRGPRVRRPRVGAVVIRVLLADDHHLIRAGIRGLLELTPDLSVVGEAADGEETAELLVTLRPDVAVLDVRMPKCSGIEALARASARGVAPPTILLTTFDDDAALREGVAAGIAGFLLKDVSLDELALAIRKVAAGETFFR